MKKHNHIKQNNKTMKPNTVAKRKAKSQNMNRKIKKNKEAKYLKHEAKIQTQHHYM